MCDVKKNWNIGRPVLYWSLGIGGIEFIAEGDWRTQNAMYHPRENGLTWRWFREAYPSLWEIFLECFDDDPDTDPELRCPPPDLDDVFDITLVPGYEEGDFPPWEDSDEECPVPMWIQERYGDLQSSVLNGPYVYFPPERKETIFRALRRDGYRVLQRPPE